MKQKVWSGALALMVLASASGFAVAQQQPAIPDAPKPQYPQLNKVVPGSGTTSTSNGDALPAAPTPDTFQPPVGTTLPQAPAAPDQAPPEVLPGQGEGVGAITTLVVRANFVEVPFTVKDTKGRLVPGITWRDVRVYENGLRQKMSVFTVDPFPLSVALVIDQSLPFDVMTRVNNALGALQGAFTAYDEVAVFSYNNGPKKLTDFTAGQSALLGAIIDRSKTTGRDPMFYDQGSAMGGGLHINNGAQDHINPITAPGGMTGTQNQSVPREYHTLNDAILEAAKSLSKTGRGRRRIVYVISDGKELGSAAKQKDVIKYLQTNKIAVYATLVGDSAVEGMGFVDRLHLPLMMRDNILPTYTQATGGEFYAEYRTKGIEQSFARITEDVRTQYTVGYQTSEPFIDGKYRKLEVRVMRPGLQVIAKDGYYPSSADARPSTIPVATP